jgi:hypothetical protein
MENINYSLVEYFEKKYPKQKYKVKCNDGIYREEMTDWEFYGPGVCHPITEIGKLGYEEYNKLITDLRKLFTPYNLKIYSEDGDDVYNPLSEKNKVSFSREFKEHVFHYELIEDLPCEPGIVLPGSIFTFLGYSNITPEIFLEDIKNILEKYCILGWNGNDKQELNSVASVFMKYIEIKTPPHIIKLRQSYQNTIKMIGERENKLNWELKQYKDLKELQDMKDLVEKNKILMEENIKLVEKEDVRQKVQQWLKNNSDKINFKIGKELYDIIN